MRLGVNGLRLIGQRSGVGRVIEAILQGLGELPHPFGEVLVYTPKPLTEDVLLPPMARNIVLPSRLPAGLWEQFILPRAHNRSDLLLCPSYVSPLAIRAPVLLIHHGSYEGYPGEFNFFERNKARLLYTASAWRSTHIATVSEHSKRDIVRFYGVRPEKITVIPNGVDRTCFRPIDDEDVLSRWRVSVLASDAPFLLYVGKPARRRNLPTLVRAFGELKRELAIPHKLLLIGVDLPKTDLQELVTSLNLRSEVYCKPHVDQAEIALAYNASSLFVYPSSYEGFGLPVLEAMACGTPVIAMNSTSFPEFSQGIAELLPNADVSTLRNAIASMLDEPDLRPRVRYRGPERAALYDWNISIGKYVDLMTTVAKMVR